MKTLRIGSGAGYSGDRIEPAVELAEQGDLDYLVFDYLAEVTMSILAGARLKDPKAGYATDFVEVLTPLLADIQRQGIRVISNAGGINPQACAAALQAACDNAHIPLKIAVLLGDDLHPQLKQLPPVTDMFNGAPLPPLCVSANAYLGAPGIAQALGLGADIVITGRVVDSAVVSAALVHEFNWSWQDYDHLAQAAGSTGQLLGQLLVEHRRIGFGGRATRQAGLRDRVAQPAQQGACPALGGIFHGKARKRLNYGAGFVFQRHAGHFHPLLMAEQRKLGCAVGHGHNNLVKYFATTPYKA